MYLKSIEMQGFKSFADKTKVVFDQGVTAVVGPNGSGKSNITESLRWALGESSAKSLRGGKMPDVIFAGTANRKPLNYASVIVTLDNSNGFIADKAKEIKVERHIYRSGDSDYLIDGKKVRLRDIHDLFMDTGLGRDSFSIISQGRVEAIFNSKPEERRSIFEEAAGVLKYKTRKKETESKLAQTQDNLDRLEDIIYELDNQVKSLEKQAQTAKRFMELDEERKALYLNVLVAQLQSGRANLTEKEDLLKEVKQELTSYYALREQLEQENQQLKVQRYQVSEQLEKEQATLLDLTRLISDVERKIDLHKLETSQNESSKADAQERLNLLQEKGQQLSFSLTEKEAQVTDLQASLTEIEHSISTTEEEISHFSEDPDQVIEHLRENYVSCLQAEAETSNRLTKVEQEQENQLRLRESKSQELQKIIQDKAKLEEQESESKEALVVAEQQLKDLLVGYQSTQAQLTSQENLYQAEQSRMFDLLDQVKAKEARKSSLEAIQKNHSNFYAGVKAVLQKAREIGGVIGAVSEHLTFDTRYQTAIEIALGGASQHIIVENEETAKAAIQFLKKNRQGRATFLPLTTIKPRQLASQYQATLEKAKGYLGTAEELIAYDARLSSVFQNLLGATAIFDTIDHANQAARATRYQVRMVTLDGSEIRTGGSFAGGANRNQNTTFIEPELDAVVKEIAELSRELKEQEELVASKKAELELVRAELDTIKTDGETARLAEQKVRLNYEQIAECLADVNRLYELHVEENGETELADLSQLAASLRQELADFEIKKAELTAQIEQVKTNRDAIQEQLQALQTNLSEQKVQESQTRSELRFSQTEIKRLRDESLQTEKEIGLLKDVIDQKMEALDDTSRDVLEQQLAEAITRKETTNQSLVRLKFELEDIEGQFEDLEGRLEQARLKNDDLIRRQAKLEADCDQLSQILRTLMANLTEHFKMSFEEASQMAEIVEDLPAAERQLKDLERAIRALGPVNLDAIQQYDEVHERLIFLNSQRGDVLSARDLLLGTIHEMDDEVKERFKVTFDAIRTSFQQTFKQMFGGGSANPLERKFNP